VPVVIDRTTDSDARVPDKSGKCSGRGFLKMTWYGRVTDAKFDGKEYATQDDPDHTLVTLKKLSDRQFEERDKREGQIFDIVMWTVSADGKTITSVDEDPRHGTKSSMTCDNQP